MLSINKVIDMNKLVMAAGVLLVCASCAGNSEKKQVDSDSTALADVEEMVAAVRDYVCITADSVGFVAIGMPINELPDSVPGLYDHKNHGTSPDAVAFIFSDAEGDSFVAYDFGEGNVDVINLIGRQIKVAAPQGVFGMGDSFSNVLQLPEVQAEWAGTGNGGSWYWVWNGIWFAPSNDNLSESASRKLFDSHQPPLASDFTDADVIGFIGTGLPY